MRNLQRLSDHVLDALYPIHDAMQSRLRLGWMRRNHYWPFSARHRGHKRTLLVVHLSDQQVRYSINCWKTRGFDGERHCFLIGSGVVHRATDLPLLRGEPD